MSFVAITHRRGLERTLAILSVLSVLLSLMVILAPPALAHHPEITASLTCVDGKVRIAYESVSWKTDGTPGSGNSDIRIEVQVNGAGSWIEVGAGSYSAGNSYRFSGTFDAAPYWGDNIVVRARAAASWNNGVAGGDTRSTSPIVVTQDCFNPSCPDQYLEHKVEPVSAGLHGTYFTISNIQAGGSGPSFDWSSTAPVYQVIVKGGPGANVYDYPSGANADSGLHAPQNTKNGKWYGLSHVTFCYGEPVPEPDLVSVTPNPLVCEPIQGSALGAVSFNIDPASGATVQVYSDPAHTVPVGPALDDDESLGVPPGTYYWVATAASADFEIDGPTSGQFTIDPCSSSVVVVSGDCVVNSNGAPIGSVSVRIDPTSGATVQVSGPGGPYLFSGSGGSQELAPGSYTWTASPGAGYQLTGDTEDGFTIDPCSSSVVVVSGDCVINSNGGPTGSVSVSIDPTSGATVQVSGPGGPYLFSGSGGSQELAPGAYTWMAMPESGFVVAGDSDGEFTIAPCDAAVVVAFGVCEIADGGNGSVTVAIDSSAAVVTVYDKDLNPVAEFSGTGGWSLLMPGTYTWKATAVAGFEFPADQVTSGQFTIDPCAGSVVVTHGNCLPGTNSALGSVMVNIDPNSSASVRIVNGSSQVVAAFSGTGGSQPLPAGDYRWSAEAASGFVIEGASSGDFTVVGCPDEVLGGEIENDDPEEIEDEVEVTQLPFTGLDSGLLFGMSLVLLGSGLTFIRYARRREEG